MGEVVEKEISERVLGVAFCIHRELGAGLLEAVYEEAFCVELKHHGIGFERQKQFPVFYRGVLVGEYFADLIVEGKILLELKAVKGFSEAMDASVHALYIPVRADLAPSWCTDSELPCPFACAGRVPPELSWFSGPVEAFRGRRRTGLGSLRVGEDSQRAAADSFSVVVDSPGVIKDSFRVDKDSRRVVKDSLRVDDESQRVIKDSFSVGNDSFSVAVDSH